MYHIIIDKKNKLPHIITLTRIVLAPAFFFSVLDLSTLNSILIFFLTIITDGLDGYVARKLKATSSKGAYLDVVADFIWILAAFSAFALIGLYPAWLLIIFGLMFLQFVITSRFKIPVYDPVGKYYGSFLFLTIFISLILNSTFINTCITLLIVIFSGVSIASRFYYLIKQKNKDK